MIVASDWRNKQQKDKIDGTSVDRIEMYWPIQAREHAEKPIEPFDAGMREGDAISQPRGTQLLTSV